MQTVSLIAMPQQRTDRVSIKLFSAARANAQLTVRRMQPTAPAFARRLSAALATTMIIRKAARPSATLTEVMAAASTIR